MKSIRDKLTSILAILMSITALTGCVHRDFEFDSGATAHLDVVFDWSNEPHAQPATMSLYLFPRDGREPQRFEFIGRDGGRIRVAPGDYDAICINSDARGVYYRGMAAHSTFEVTTSEATVLTFGAAFSFKSFDLPRASGAEDQPIASLPPLLWAASSREVTVTPAGDGEGAPGNRELRMFPARIVDTYAVTVRHINNVKHLRALSATISGMSDGHVAAEGIPNHNRATLPVDLTHDPVGATAQGEFLTFGHCPGERAPHKLMLYAILTDNSKYYFEFDVGDQAHEPPDADNVHHITIDLLDLPEPSAGDSQTGGMNPVVDQWQSVDIDIDM